MVADINEEKSFKNSVLLVSAFAAFLTPFLSSAVNLALPAIGKELHANAISLGWVISSFILSICYFSVCPLEDLAISSAERKFYSIGILLFTISTFLIVLFPQHPLTYIAQDIPGVSKCNDLWNEHGYSDISFSTRRKRKGNRN
jgi:MFS family permease